MWRFWWQKTWPHRYPSAWVDGVWRDSGCVECFRVIRRKLGKRNANATRNSPGATHSPLANSDAWLHTHCDRALQIRSLVREHVLYFDCVLPSHEETPLYYGSFRACTHRQPSLAPHLLVEASRWTFTNSLKRNLKTRYSRLYRGGGDRNESDLVPRPSKIAWESNKV